MASDEKLNVRDQQEQTQPPTGESKESTSGPKSAYIFVPDAERVELRDREGHEMTNVTTTSDVGTSQWAAVTATGGVMGICKDAKSLPEMADRVRKENNCSEISYRIWAHDPELWDEFAKTATHKRVRTNTGLNKDGTPQGPVDWEEISRPKN
ncbi:hypothetical protein FPOAC2_08603 [Fusarium poae]|uniref:Uncharacterized protein n=1 Tax=Fusarium poae TaxID=36050 RepID=A0A1B8ALP6_FUSPO|nr:hypothetical protein FPOAC1_008673 [Fusarium poae]KAG8669284.1 hypothetical protein FPOAC1_008673 [Fusarium poae]OBS21509.1 hypothetical protein FPOA_07846 [Fusarium poae]